MVLMRTLDDLRKDDDERCYEVPYQPYLMQPFSGRGRALDPNFTGTHTQRRIGDQLIELPVPFIGHEEGAPFTRKNSKGSSVADSNSAASLSPPGSPVPKRVRRRQPLTSFEFAEVFTKRVPYTPLRQGLRSSAQRERPLYRQKPIKTRARQAKKAVKPRRQAKAEFKPRRLSPRTKRAQ